MTRVEEPELLSVELSGLRHRAYRWHGHGSGTVLLLHGFLDTGRGWAFTVHGLLSSCRFLIALDWRGHGDSEWVGRGGYYHFFDYVRDLEKNAAIAMQEVDFMEVAHEIGFSNMWALLDVYFDRVTDRCNELTVTTWTDILGGTDVFTKDHCFMVAETIRID